MENIQVHMLVNIKEHVAHRPHSSLPGTPPVYVVLRIDNGGFALIQSKDSGYTSFRHIDELQQATIEEYRRYGYDFIVANGKQELTPYNLANFLIWVRNMHLQYGLTDDNRDVSDMTDEEMWKLASEYVAYREQSK